MEPSEEFCLSGCTCSFSLGPGFEVEEKVKKGAKKQKKKKKRQEKKRKNKQRQQQLQLQQKPWTGVWERMAEKNESPFPASHFFVISAPSFAVFFFRLFPFAAGAWAHTNKSLKRTWCCNHLYQQGIEEIL